VNGDGLMVRTSGLTRRFGDILALDRLNLEVRRGEVFGIVGPDGAGKTTTLRLLCGLIDPSEGEVQVAGRDVAKRFAEVRDRIGYMPQQFGQYLDLTVEENMRFFADLYGIVGPDRDALERRLLEMTRMAPFRNRRAGQLSGGMKQKLALMCALLHRPEALFLDEPTNGVDPVSRRDFWTILYQLVQDGLTVVLSTAYLDEAERCNRVALMYQGRVIRQGPPDELRSSIEADAQEIRCADARAARDLLRGRPDILAAETAGAGIHIFVKPEGSIDAIVGALEQAGHGPVEAARIQPSLEDAFIALVRTEQSAAAEATP